MTPFETANKYSQQTIIITLIITFKLPNQILQKIALRK